MNEQDIVNLKIKHPYIFDCATHQYYILKNKTECIVIDIIRDGRVHFDYKFNRIVKGYSFIRDGWSAQILGLGAGLLYNEYLLK